MLMISFTFELATDVNRIMESLASSRTQTGGNLLTKYNKSQFTLQRAEGNPELSIGNAASLPFHNPRLFPYTMMRP